MARTRCVPVERSKLPLGRTFGNATNRRPASMDSNPRQTSPFPPVGTATWPQRFHPGVVRMSTFASFLVVLTSVRYRCHRPGSDGNGSFLPKPRVFFYCLLAQLRWRRTRGVLTGRDESENPPSWLCRPRRVGRQETVAARWGFRPHKTPTVFDSHSSFPSSPSFIPNHAPRSLRRAHRHSFLLRSFLFGSRVLPRIPLWL